jgi:hypothetical protein
MPWSFSVEVDNGITVPSNTFQEIGDFSRNVEEPHWNAVWMPNGTGGFILK